MSWRISTMCDRCAWMALSNRLMPYSTAIISFAMAGAASESEIPDKFLKKARDAFIAQKLEEAEKWCLAAPRTSDSLTLLARVQTLTGRSREAASTLHTCLALTPTRLDTLKLL